MRADLKFIHHDCCAAITADEQRGSYDVIEDDSGTYVWNESEGGKLASFKGVEEAVKYAKRRADKYDLDRWLPAWKAAVAGGELRGFWSWLAQEYNPE